jgi:hypothetical protein
MAYPIPPRPASFKPEGVAPGCQRIPNLYYRDVSNYRMDILVVHTNWGSGEGSIRSAINWALADPGDNTYAHYQHERDGDAAKLLDSNRRGIGNSGTSAYWRQFGLPTASHRALVYETSDRGTDLDPDPVGSYFTDAQMASLARDLAYECVVHGIPPVVLPKPDGRGLVCHTWPYPYPAFTTASTKKCPGYRKIEQFKTAIVPWVAAIVQAWKSPTPIPSPEEPVTDTEIMRIAAAAADNVMARIEKMDIVGQVINYPVPVGGTHQHLWTLVLDTYLRTLSLQAVVAEGAKANDEALDEVRAQVTKLVASQAGPK